MAKTSAVVRNERRKKLAAKHFAKRKELAAIVKNPRTSPEARAALAEALVRAGRPADAVPHWLEATRLQPRRAEVWANLGSALGMAGREREAADALAEAVRLAPRDATLLIRLAFAEHGARRPADAVRHLLAAAEITGADAFPHS